MFFKDVITRCYVRRRKKQLFALRTVFLQRNLASAVKPSVIREHTKNNEQFKHALLWKWTHLGSQQFIFLPVWSYVQFFCFQAKKKHLQQTVDFIF